MSNKKHKNKRLLVVVAFVFLFILHQDFWFWGDESLVFGFMPVGLAYHAIFSICCALLGAAAIRWAWPHELEEEAYEKASS